MKIGIFVSEFNLNGGTQRIAAELARYLRQRSEDVVIYTDYYSDNCYPKITEGVEIKFLKKEKEHAKIFKNKFILYFWKIISIGKIARMIDKKTEIIVCCDLNMAIAANIIYKKYKIPFVWQINDLHESFKAREAEKKKSRLSNFIGLPMAICSKAISKAAAAIIVPSLKNKDLVKKYLNADSNVFYCGVDINKFNFRGFKKRSGAAEMLSIGIMYPYRRHELLIKAIKSLKDKNVNIHLTILGSSINCPAYAEELKALARNLKIENNVLFLEEVSELELINIYAKADIFAFMSYQETWGLAVFEAMAIGVPVIVSETAGAVEVLENKKNAVIVPDNNVWAITEAVEELLRDEKFSQKIIENGRRLVENMSWKNMYCKKVEDLLYEIKLKIQNGA